MTMPIGRTLAESDMLRVLVAMSVTCRWSSLINALWLCAGNLPGDLQQFAHGVLLWPGHGREPGKRRMHRPVAPLPDEVSQWNARRCVSMRWYNHVLPSQVSHWLVFIITVIVTGSVEIATIRGFGQDNSQESRQGQAKENSSHFTTKNWSPKWMTVYSKSLECRKEASTAAFID